MLYSIGYRLALAPLWLGLGIFIMSWVVTVPTVIAAFFIGYKAPPVSAVWLLLALGIICAALIPISPGAAGGSDALVYLSLPVIVPVFVLVPYAFGSFMRYIAKRRRNP